MPLLCFFFDAIFAADVSSLLGFSFQFLLIAAICRAYYATPPAIPARKKKGDVRPCFDCQHYHHMRHVAVVDAPPACLTDARLCMLILFIADARVRCRRARCRLRRAAQTPRHHACLHLPLPLPAAVCSMFSRHRCQELVAPARRRVARCALPTAFTPDYSPLSAHYHPLRFAIHATLFLAH